MSKSNVNAVTVGCEGPAVCEVHVLLSVMLCPAHFVHFLCWVGGEMVGCDTQQGFHCFFFLVGVCSSVGFVKVHFISSYLGVAQSSLHLAPLGLFWLTICHRGLVHLERHGWAGGRSGLCIAGEAVGWRSRDVA